MSGLQKHNAKSSKKLAKVPKNAIGRLLQGDVVTSDFFAKHKIMIFAIVVLTMFYIITKYQSMTGIEQIRKLETELEVVKTERIRERSTYMSRIRESSMAHLADSIRPGLSIHQAPPFELSY